jgi:hypothetical protein
MMPRYWLKTICLTIWCAGPALFAHEFYIAPGGSDQNPGTVKAPFKTLERAQQAVRTADRRDPGETVVYLRGGTYNLDKTIEFDAGDSGTETHPVVYRAYPDETPVISGGKKITGWEKTGKLIYSAPTGGMHFRQLYVNGKKALRSRTPNPGQYWRLTRWDIEKQQIIMPQGTLQDWESFDEVEAFIQMLWSISVMRLDTFSTVEDGTALTVKNPERDLIFKRTHPKKLPDQSFHLENAREFIDLPGEWALSRKSGLCYYLPAEGVDMAAAEIIVPRLETLVRIQGTYDNPVRNLRFEGLTFKYSNWKLPGERGYLNVQAGQFNIEPTVNNVQYVGRPAAAVYAACVENLVFKRNIFTKLGATGLDIHYGSRNCEVVGNVFYDIAGTGISHARISDPDVEIHTPYNPEELRDRSVNDWIHNNYIESIGFEYGGTIGILSGWPTAVRIEHNELRNLAYSGISVGWGWTPKPSAMRDNKICANLIDRPMALYTDGGGIYTLSEMPGSLISRNVILNVEESEWTTWKTSSKCYYLDEYSGGITFDQNIEREIAKGVERMRLHFPGVITVTPLFPEQCEEIEAQAGLQPEYRDIKEALNHL